MTIPQLQLNCLIALAVFSFWIGFSLMCIRTHLANIVKALEKK